METCKAGAFVLSTALALSGCASGGGPSEEEAESFMRLLICMTAPWACGRALAGSTSADCCTPRQPSAFTQWENHVWDRTQATGISTSVPYEGTAEGTVLAMGGASLRDGVSVVAYFDPQKRFGSLTTDEVDLHKPYSGYWTLPGHETIERSRHDATAQGLVGNPYSNGWSYQSFGAWNDPAAGAARFGATSFGAPTPGLAVPTSGTASFHGKLGGFHVSTAGAVSSLGADVQVGADFGARTLSFASSGTAVMVEGRATPAPQLDLRGTLAYSPGSTRFSGTLSNAGGTVSGGSSGSFYGPAAQELGGVFTLRSANTVESFTGAYGAKR